MPFRSGASRTNAGPTFCSAPVSPAPSRSGAPRNEREQGFATTTNEKGVPRWFCDVAPWPPRHRSSRGAEPLSNSHEKKQKHPYSVGRPRHGEAVHGTQSPSWLRAMAAAWLMASVPVPWTVPTPPCSTTPVSTSMTRMVTRVIPSDSRIAPMIKYSAPSRDPSVMHAMPNMALMVDCDGNSLPSALRRITYLGKPPAPSLTSTFSGPAGIPDPSKASTRPCWMDCWSSSPIGSLTLIGSLST